MAMPEVGIGFIPRYRRHVHPVACTRPARPSRSADGRTVRRWRRDRHGLRRPLRPARQPRRVQGRDRRRRHRRRTGRTRNRAAGESSCWRNGNGSTSAIAGETVEDIVAALRGHDAGPANDAANLIMTRSPVSLSVALEAVRRAAKLDTLEDVLRQEYRTTCAVAEFARSRRRDPRAGHRQGPQPEMVAARRWPRSPRPTSTRTSHPEPRPDLPRGDDRATRPSSSTATSASAPSR